jgi:hypothetical protein
MKTPCEFLRNRWAQFRYDQPDQGLGMSLTPPHARSQYEQHTCEGGGKSRLPVSDVIFDVPEKMRI